MGDCQISGTWTRTDHKLHINCLELKAVISALQHWAPVLQGHQVMIATDNSTVVSYINKQARRDPFPHLATFDSRPLPLVRGSEHNSPGKAYSRLSERDSRPPISSESASIDRVVPPSQDRETYLQALGDTRRPSTNRMYNDRWLRFARWATGQGFDPLDPTAAQIASFLFTLFDTHGLSPQTVKGYRTCLGLIECLIELARPKWFCTRPSPI